MEREEAWINAQAEFDATRDDKVRSYPIKKIG